jgi:hypothetical protein
MGRISVLAEVHRPCVLCRCVYHAGAQERNAVKAGLLYDTISGSNGFYFSPVEESVRSKMNVPFTIPSNADLEKAFIAGGYGTPTASLASRMLHLGSAAGTLAVQSPLCLHWGLRRCLQGNFVLPAQCSARSPTGRAMGQRAVMVWH